MQEEKKEKTFEEIKNDIQVNREVSDEEEGIIANTARKELELERANRR
jgi:hypothetical protein